MSLLLLLACSEPEAPVNEPAPDPEAQSRAMLEALGYLDEVEAEEGAPSGLVDRVGEAGGYTLYLERRPSRAVLVDAAGQAVHSWAHPDPGMFGRVRMLADGDLIVVGATEPPGGGRGAPWDSRYLARIDWSGEVLWQTALTAHHDVIETPDGELLTLDQRLVEHADAPEGELLLDHHLVWLDPQDGRVLRSRSIYELLRSRPDRFVPSWKGPLREHGGRRYRDVLHTNSVAIVDVAETSHPLAGPERVIVCLRHQDAVAVFDLAANELVWAWGPGELEGPHDAEVLPSGNVLVFDNGIERRWSRVLEVDPRTDEVVWSLGSEGPDRWFTHSRGSVQRLDDGHHLVGLSESGRGIELDASGRIVWDYRTLPGETGTHPTINRVERLPAGLVEPLLQRTP